MSTDFSNLSAVGVTDEGTYTPDRLYPRDVLDRKITLVSGAGAQPRGALLGKITKAGATSAVKASGANTGNATMSAVTVAQGVKVGVYTVRMLTATTFRVEDPDGFVIGDGATGTAFADDLGFTMTAGGTPMVAGDGFDVTVAAGSGKYKLSLAAATDGSEVPDVVLLHPADATSADVDAIVAIAGRFNGGAITFGTGHTVASTDAVLRIRDIHFDTVIG